MSSIGEQHTGVGWPGERAYQEATEVFNLSAPPHPAAAVTVRTVPQVQAALRLATRERLGVRMQATGHAAAAVPPIRGGLLLRTELAEGIDLDVRRRRARIPAGTRWGDVVRTTAAHGLSAAHGSSAEVGVVGYLLRGGLSFYGRAVGLGVNSIQALELVTADGEVRQVDATSDPELFWAIRGGGGGFGVVTAIEINLFPATRIATGAAFWPASPTGSTGSVERLLSTWWNWTKTAPRSITTAVRVMNLPPGPQVPAVLSAGPMFCVDGAVLGPEQDDPETTAAVMDDLLAPLLAIAPALINSWESTTALGVLEAHLDPARPVAFVGDHFLLRELDSDAVGSFLEATGPGSGSPLVISGLRQLGGAFAERDPESGVLGHLDAAFSYAGSGVPGPEGPGRIRAHCARIRAALAPWETGRTAPCFVESHDQPQGHLSESEITRVDQVRARVDPNGVFGSDISPNATHRV